MQLLLIEDDPVISRELSLRWQSRGWWVQPCGTLAEADRQLAEIGASLIVLDLGLPDGDGLAWLQQLRLRDTRTPVLVLTARDQVADRVRGLQTGADDYLVKPFAVDELDARVEGLLRRAGVAQDDNSRCGDLLLLRSEGRAYLRGQPLELSRREFEVLALLVLRSPRVVPKRVLIDALAERNLEVGDSASEVYVSRLRRKLAGSGVSIHTLRGFGYRLAPDGPAAAGPEPGP